MASVMPMTWAMCREFFLVSSLICHTSRGPIISLNFRSTLDQISIRWPQGYFQGTGHSSPHLESRKDNTRIYLPYQPRWIHWMGQADFFFRRSGRLFDRERSFIDDTLDKFGKEVVELSSRNLCFLIWLSISLRIFLSREVINRSTISSWWYE